VKGGRWNAKGERWNAKGERWNVKGEKGYNTLGNYPVYIISMIFLFMFQGCIRDMDRQPSIRPFEETRQSFPEGTISINDDDEISKDIDYNTMQNPFPKSEEIEEPGKTFYGFYCSHCHGNKADGESPVGQSLGVHPENLLDSKIQSKNDGDLFYIITFGENAMPSLKTTVKPDERWLIIHHLRLLKESN